MSPASRLCTGVAPAGPALSLSRRLCRSGVAISTSPPGLSTRRNSAERERHLVREDVLDVVRASRPRRRTPTGTGDMSVMLAMMSGLTPGSMSSRTSCHSGPRKLSCRSCGRAVRSRRAARASAAAARRSPPTPRGACTARSRSRHPHPRCSLPDRPLYRSDAAWRARPIVSAAPSRRGLGSRPMVTVHVVAGVTLLVLNLAAGRVGAWCWHRVEPSPRFWHAAARRAGGDRRAGAARRAAARARARAGRRPAHPLRRAAARRLVHRRAAADRLGRRDPRRARTTTPPPTSASCRPRSSASSCSRSSAARWA